MKPKRVVSIGEYVAHQCHYFTKSWIGGTLGAAGLMAAVAGCLVLFCGFGYEVKTWIVSRHLPIEAGGQALTFVGIVGGFVGVSVLLALWGNALSKSAQQMEPVVPLT